MNAPNSPKENKFIGLDYGTKVIGTAHWTRGEDFFVQMGARLTPEGGNLNHQLVKLIRTWQPEAIVCGVPLNNENEETQMSCKIRKELAQLLEHFPEIQIYYEDERDSSQEARERMESSPEFNFQFDPKKVDSLSAVIILERFVSKIKAVQ